MLTRSLSIHVFVLFFLSFTIFPNISFALDPTDLAGDYSLTAFEIQYDGYPKVTSAQASYFSGRLSMTTKGFVADMSGSAVGQYIAQYFCGFYTTYSWSDTLSVSIKGGGSGSMDALYTNGTLVTSGYNYDDDGDRYWLKCTWEKDQFYYTSSGYTQAQLDQAVAVAVSEKDNIIASMFTQAQLDQAVASAVAGKDAIIAAMFSQEQLNNAINNAEAAKNVIIAQKDKTISDLNTAVDSMFTQEQLTQAISDVEVTKNEIILQKDKTISALSDLDGDKTTDMKDIVWGLQVLSGGK